MVWYMHLYAHLFQSAYKNLFSIALSVYKSDPWGQARLSDLFFSSRFPESKEKYYDCYWENIIIERNKSSKIYASPTRNGIKP